MFTNPFFQRTNGKEIRSQDEQKSGYFSRQSFMFFSVKKDVKKLDVRKNDVRKLGFEIYKDLSLASFPQHFLRLNKYDNNHNS